MEVFTRQRCRVLGLDHQVYKDLAAAQPVSVPETPLQMRRQAGRELRRDWTAYSLRLGTRHSFKATGADTGPGS
eukprot:1408653-Rhodomonas_salina.11